ncbi:MAG: hypothetical protein ACKVZH_20710 [Blastocatellia bacterium]
MAEKEPFIGATDRADVGLKPDVPITQLTVRDLSLLLSEVIKVKKLEIKDHKLEIKEHKHEKFEIKELKHEIKDHKFEKFEKNEKLEIEVDQKRVPDNIPDPREIFEDPRFKQLIASVSQLADSVKTLNERIVRLEGKGK